MLYILIIEQYYKMLIYFFQKVVIPTTISCAYYQSVTTPTSIRSCPPNVTHFNNSLSEMTPPNAEPDNDLYESTPRSTHYMDYSTSAICTNYGNHSSRTPTTFTNTIGHSFITPRRVSNSSDETFLMPSKLNYSESPRTPAPSSSTYSVHHTVLTPPTSPESDNYSGFIIRRTLAFDVEISPTSQNTPASEDGHPTRTELSNSTFVSLSRARSGSRTRGGSIKPSSLSLPDIGNDNYVSGTRANRKRVSQRQVGEITYLFMYDFRVMIHVNNLKRIL